MPKFTQDKADYELRNLARIREGKRKISDKNYFSKKLPFAG